MSRVQRVVVAITGASGAALGLTILERLAPFATIETHAVVSNSAIRTLVHEVGPDGPDRVAAAADHTHDAADIGATIASGSFRTAGMIVAPCSMRTLAAIAMGLADNLIVRAADVHLKERRRLVLMPRETPLHLGHLRNMVATTEMGAILLPPVPAFYQRPRTIADITHHLAARAIDLLSLDIPDQAKPWTGEDTSAIRLTVDKSISKRP